MPIDQVFGTAPIAAMNIVSTVDNIALVLFMGISSAVAIMAGKVSGRAKTRTLTGLSVGRWG